MPEFTLRDSKGPPPAGWGEASKGGGAYPELASMRRGSSPPRMSYLVVSFSPAAIRASRPPRMRPALRRDHLVLTDTPLPVLTSHTLSSVAEGFTPYPPRACGIATYCEDLVVSAMAATDCSGVRMSSARETALRALWGTDEFLDSTGYVRPSSPLSAAFASGVDQSCRALRLSVPRHQGWHSSWARSVECIAKAPPNAKVNESRVAEAILRGRSARAIGFAIHSVGRAFLCPPAVAVL